MRSQLGTAPVDFPLEEVPAVVESSSAAEGVQQPLKEQLPSTEHDHHPPKEQVSTMPTPVQTPTTQTSEAPSETGSTDLTTPSPAITPQAVKSQPTATPQPRHIKTVVPVVPAVPILPLSPKASRHSHRDSMSVVSSSSNTQLESSSEQIRRSSTTSMPTTSDVSPVVSAETSKPVSPPALLKSWADLVRSKAPPKPSNNTAAVSQIANGLSPARNETLSDVHNTMDVTATDNAAKIAFLKPRGLVNTGNMCYMNSVSAFLDQSETKAYSCRCCKSWFSVFHFTNFLKKLGKDQLTVSKTILP